MELDLSSFDVIKQFCTQIKTEFPRFDCLINNAGMSTKHPQVVPGTDKELTFATNHLGTFLLTELLRENIRANVSRIVVVSSNTHVRGKIEFDKLGKCGDVKSSLAAYQNSKLANFYFARELFKHGFDAHVLCPGLCNTDFFRDYNPRWYHYVAFSPIVWLALRSSEQVTKQNLRNILVFINIYVFVYFDFRVPRTLFMQQPIVLIRPRRIQRLVT